MFNLKSHNKESQVSPYEKYHRKDNVGPEADDSQAIWEKELPHREPDKYTITEDQMKEKAHKLDEDSDSEIIQKVLEDATSKYMDHRAEPLSLDMMPINAHVEDLRQERLKEDWKPEKEAHWSQDSEKKQFGKLPNWKKNAPQHDKVVLNNDHDRFKSKKPVSLVGGITTADVERIAYNIKTGASIDYDTAIVAILREADRLKEELTDVERRAIVDLKIARTKFILKAASKQEETEPLDW